MRFTKEQLNEKLKLKASEFILKQNLIKNNSSEIKEFLSIAKQINENIGFGVEYPIRMKKNLIHSFIELMGFFVQREDTMRNANHEIIDRLAITFLLDIDIDTPKFQKEWLRHDESIHLYYEKK
jgi:hypothetical protein